MLNADQVMKIDNTDTELKVITKGVFKRQSVNKDELIKSNLYTG
jgi:hypothetical protein